MNCYLYHLFHVFIKRMMNSTLYILILLRLQFTFVPNEPKLVSVRHVMGNMFCLFQHHCRKCGKVCCNTCTSKRWLLKHQSSKPLRVCLTCYSKLSAPPANGASQVVEGSNASYTFSFKCYLASFKFSLCAQVFYLLFKFSNSTGIIVKYLYKTPLFKRNKRHSYRSGMYSDI